MTWNGLRYRVLYSESADSTFMFMQSPRCSSATDRQTDRHTHIDTHAYRHRRIRTHTHTDAAQTDRHSKRKTRFGDEAACDAHLACEMIIVHCIDPKTGGGRMYTHVLCANFIHTDDSLTICVIVLPETLRPIPQPPPPPPPPTDTKTLAQDCPDQFEKPRFLGF